MPQTSTPHPAPTPRGFWLAEHVWWLGLGVTAGFWLVDSCFDAFILHRGPFLKCVWPLDDLNTLVDRSWMGVALLIFGLVTTRIGAQRTQAEAALGESEGRARIVVETALDAVVTMCKLKVESRRNSRSEIGTD